MKQIIALGIIFAIILSGCAQKTTTPVEPTPNGNDAIGQQPSGANPGQIPMPDTNSLDTQPPSLPF